MPSRAMIIGDLTDTYWPILVCALLVSLAATPLCRRIALARGMVDRPDDFLKPHARPIPYLGGVAIAIGWLAGVLLAMGLLRGDGAVPGSGPGPTMDTTLMIGVLVAGFVTVAVGLCDDLHLLSPRIKLTGNIVAALLLTAFGLGHDVIRVFVARFQLDFGSSDWWLVTLYSVPVTVFIVVGACNATNLIDGLDGLCSGVLGIISVGFLILACHLHLHREWNPSDVQRVVLSLAMLGAALGFLPFNRNPAKIFMGDAGSMLLGLNAAVLMLLFMQEYALRWAMAAVMIFGLPITDLVLTLLRRWRNQRPLMQGDRSHFYDQLVDRGYTVRQVVIVSYAWAAFFAAMGCLSIVVRTRYAILLYLGVVAVTVAAVVRFDMVRIEGPSRTPATPNGS